MKLKKLSLVSIAVALGVLVAPEFSWAVRQMDYQGQCKAWMERYTAAYKQLEKDSLQKAGPRHAGVHRPTPQQEASLTAIYDQMPSICHDVEGFRVPIHPFDNGAFANYSNPNNFGYVN